MKFVSSKSAIFALALIIAPLVHAAESGVDYSFVPFRDISSTNPSVPTVVNKVTVMCPADGNLIATASAQITMSSFSGQPGEADVEYGISRNSTASDPNQQHELRQYTDSGTTFGTAQYQRTGTCKANQTVSFRFVAHRLGAETASALNSSLVVTFIGNPRI